MKTGLVLEGGAMRGIYTAGVLDVFLEQGIHFDGVIGVSAGALHGCSFVSGQKGRSLRYYVPDAVIDYIRENNIYIMRKNLKNYNPRKAQTGLGSIIFNSYIRNIFFYFSFVLIFSLTYLLRIYIPDINEVFLYVLFGVLAIADIAVYILIRKRVKKRKKKKFIDETKNEYNYWMSQINNDAKELNILKPAIQDEYKKFNIAPEYRSQHAMHSMYDILSHHSTMTVLDAMKK